MTSLLAGRWIGWALIASLALNLFLAGVVGMRYWREYTRERPAFAGPVGRITSSMPESAREKVKAVVEARQPEMRERSREFRRARNEAMQVLAAESFEREKAAAAFAEARRRADAMSTTMEGVLIEAAATLTPEERRAFRERLAERERERERRWPSAQR